MKPLKPRPHLYACIFPALQSIARERGYNLVLHGSLNRDMDLVAIPWVDDPKPHLELLQEMERYVSGVQHTKVEDYGYSVLPGGRHSYYININRGGRYNNYLDEEFYFDISITPLVKNES